MRFLRLIVISLVIISCITQPGNARSKTRLGFFGGLDFGRIKIPDNITLNSHIGLGAGCIIEIPLNDQVSLQPEIQYVGKGAEANPGSSLSVTQRQLSIRYIAIPVLLKVSIPGSIISPHFLFGPELGIKTAATGYYPYMSLGFYYPPYPTSFGFDNQTELINVCLDVGGGFDIDLDESTSIMVDLRYSYGLTNIIKNMLPPKTTTRDIQIFTGVTFDL